MNFFFKELKCYLMVMWRLADWHWGIINQRLPSRSLDLIIRSRFRPSLMWNNFLKQGQAVLWKIGFVMKLKVWQTDLVTSQQKYFRKDFINISNPVHDAISFLSWKIQPSREKNSNVNFYPKSCKETESCH